LAVVAVGCDSITQFGNARDARNPCHGYGFLEGRELPTRTRTRDYP